MMHYFKRNIGDYHKKAGRLTMLEHGAYTLLLDACYDRERFPTMEEAIDWCWARNKEEIDAVELVLRKFFDLIDGRYVQLRIQDEIDAYHSMSLKNKEIAANREAAKRTKRAPGVNEPAPNQEPLTNNQEPIDQKNTSQATAGDLFLKFWALYPRKQDKAKAQKAWAKLKVTGDLFSLIINGLSAQAVSADWLKDGGKYIPMPTTWLNGHRWEDEILDFASNVHPFPVKKQANGPDFYDQTWRSDTSDDL
ncbi:YdaU family protein [Pseudomonas gregormendelii]